MTASIINFRVWKEEREAEIAARREELIQSLRAAVPASLETYIGEECYLIPNLVDYGRAGMDYTTDETYYGYKDLAELRRFMRRLKRAWRGLVKIQVFTEGPDKVEVIFTAIG